MADEVDEAMGLDEALAVARDRQNLWFEDRTEGEKALVALSAELERLRPRSQAVVDGMTRELDRLRVLRMEAERDQLREELDEWEAMRNEWRDKAYAKDVELERLREMKERAREMRDSTVTDQVKTALYILRDS